tara:strand:+ start:1448 stop:3082 length:1635 start_codon:yes stop_codon:yes gene_type:complete
MAEETIKERWRLLDAQRETKLERARKCAALTVPSVLPPQGWTEQEQLPQPYSSVGARGVTNMASRILSAMLPLNDTPFFRFDLSTGIEPDQSIWNFLESLSYQVHNKLNSKNLRETIFAALQHLIVAGDVCLIMEDDYNFRLLRLDQYVARRSVEGELKELIYIEYVAKDNDQPATDMFYQPTLELDRKGYDTWFIRLTKEDDGTWKYRAEDSEGDLKDEGTYTVSPYVCLRWSSVAGENYGRSHCEDIIGDLVTLESFTEALIEGTAAGSAFWIGVDPAGITELDDVVGTPNGSFVAAREQDIFTLSPSGTMNPQIQATQNGVETMRREVGNAFLLTGSAIPSGERVTATAVRMIGSELETILGGAFSAIARDLMEPIVRRTVFLMLANQEIDPRLAEQFSEGGILTVEIVTGLQALSRDSDLQKLMQMGEMVRNLPDPAMSLFRWQEYARALITSIGFDATKWVKTEEEAKQQAQEIAQFEQNIQTQGAMQQGAAQAVTGGIQQAAQQDIAETGGQNIQAMIEQNPELLQQLQAALGGGGNV